MNVTANGIRIEYGTFGDRAAEPLLLVMGLGAQMINWHEEFCEDLAARGHYVIRYDNRDVGLSSKIESAGVPNIPELMAARARGETPTFPYSLNDMADDGIGLLDALGIAKSHIVGASMGGMIVQAMAIRHPGRVLTMTSIMSTTSEPDLPPAKPEAMAVLVTPAPADREGNIEHSVKNARVIGCAPHLFDEDRIREGAARRYDRQFYPVGMARQMAAVSSSGGRRAALAGVTTPTLVIHGAIDPLVPVEGGIDTAKAIPGAELLILDDMGHDLPKGLYPEIVGAIAKHTSRVAVAV